MSKSKTNRTRRATARTAPSRDASGKFVRRHDMWSVAYTMHMAAERDAVRREAERLAAEWAAEETEAREIARLELEAERATAIESEQEDVLALIDETERADRWVLAERAEQERLADLEAERAREAADREDEIREAAAAAEWRTKRRADRLFIALSAVAFATLSLWAAHAAHAAHLL